MVGLILGMAAPTYLIGRVFSFPWLNTAINRRIWCSDATSVERVDIIGSRSASGVRYNTVIVCRRGEETLRTLGTGRIQSTGWVLAFVVSLLAAVLLIVALWGWSKLRKRA